MTNNMKFYNKDTKELNDTEIMHALMQAIEDYENGDILDCRDTLSKIVSVINQFEKDY